MNWKQRLFKPKWQNKNADIRLESVTHEQHLDLINSLVEIAGNDEDIRIRCAAIKRLHQLENILNLYSGETDSEVKSLLEDRIRQLAASSNEQRPPLKFRMQVIESTSDRDLIEHLASHAPEAELRRAALTKVERQGLLGDCCVQDKDADNRRYAASRINQTTTLKRVIGELRKRDKLLHGELQARLHKELLEAGDPKEVQVEALKICVALEKKALATSSKDGPGVKKLQDSWQPIATMITSEMADRYQRVCERIAAPQLVAATPKPAPVVEPEQVTQQVSEAVAEQSPPKEAAVVEPVANESLARIAKAICVYENETEGQASIPYVAKLKKQIENTWQKCKPPHDDDVALWDEAGAALKKLEEKIELQHQQAEKELAQANDLLKKLETELEQGELHNALTTRAELQQLEKAHGKDKDWKQLHSNLLAMQARLRELRDWHHWSNNKVRNRLIAEMEVLPAADLHPDALLDRVKSLQAEWKVLEKSEQIPGDKKFMAAPWMWRKFSAAGHTAFDTAKPYLDKRSEIQSRHADTLTTFCDELEQLAEAEPINWTALSNGLTKGRKKLRDLNSVPVSVRQKLAKQLKAALDKANNTVQTHYQSIEQEKMKLIRAASQLIHMPERSEAITQAKSLQSNWKAAGSLWRSKEQELWEQFREHLDPLFDELKQQQADIRTADKDRLTAQKVLCTELRDILDTDDDLSALHGKVQGLQDSWKGIQQPDRKLLSTFQDMVEKYQQKVIKAEQQQADKIRERWWLKSALLHELTVSGRTTKGAISKKAETSVKKSWPDDSSEDTLECKLDQVFNEVLAGEGTGLLTEEEIGNMQEDARSLCIGLEFVAGLPSPEEDRNQRMKYQVDRLAESMSGESVRQPVADEARDAENTWLKMYSLPEADFNSFGKRVKQALSKIMENI